MSYQPVLCAQRGLARMRDTFNALVRDSAGQVAITFALTALPTLFFVGAAVDYTRSVSTQSRLQAALDAAVLAGVQAPSGSQISTASNVFAASSSALPGNVSSPSFSLTSQGNVQGSASVSLPTAVMGVAGMQRMTLRAASTASPSVSPVVSPCLFSLNPSTNKAVNLSSSSSIVATGCGMQVNSSSGSAVSISGSASITTSSNCIVGGVSDSSSGGISPSPPSSCASKADPFASYTLPTVSGCNFNNYKVSSGTATLSPGVYCGGLTISSSVVTFSPGLYVIKDGPLTGSGGSSFSGNGVTFFLTGSGAGVNISGGGGIHLVASNDAPLSGFVFFLDPNATPASKSVLSGSSELYYEGALYFPNQLLEMSGGSSSFTPSPLTVYIADTFNLSGGSAIRIQADPTKSAVQLPAALYAVQGKGVRLLY